MVETSPQGVRPIAVRFTHAQAAGHEDAIDGLEPASGQRMPTRPSTHQILSGSSIGLLGRKSLLRRFIGEFCPENILDHFADCGLQMDQHWDVRRNKRPAAAVQLNNLAVTCWSKAHLPKLLLSILASRPCQSSLRELIPSAVCGHQAENESTKSCCQTDDRPSNDEVLSHY